MFANAETFSGPRSFGRTLNPRPFASERQGNGDPHNLHAYVANDPVNFTDPLGLGPDDDDPIVVTAHRVGRGGAGGLGGINSPGGGPTIGANEATPAVVLPGPPLPGRPSLCLGENAQGGCAQIVVTAQFRADTPFAFDGRRFILNPYYLKPWYSDYVDVCFAVCPPLIGFAGAAAPAAIGTEGLLFARGSGLLNSNNYVRVGYGWKGPAIGGRDVFRLAVGHRTWTPITGLSRFPWHVP